MPQGMQGGLSGKARKNHSMSRGQRMYTQQWIEEFMEPGEAELVPERIIPVKPIEAGSEDSRYAYEFVSEAQEEVARSAEAQRFEEVADAARESAKVSSVGQASAPFSPASADAHSGIDSLAVASPVVPQVEQAVHDGGVNGTILCPVPIPVMPQPSNKVDWSARVQPKLFTIRRKKKKILAEIKWSGLLTGILIGGAAGAAILGILSLVV